jgi:predicted PurR-regulated permease PerM
VRARPVSPRRGQRPQHQPSRPPGRRAAPAAEPGPPGAGWWRGSLILGASLALALGTLALVWLLAKPLVLLLMAVVIAQALSPVVAAIEQWLPRAIAVTLVYVVVLVVIGAVGWAVIPPLVRQATDLLPDFPRNSPDLLTDLERWIEQWDPRGGERLIRGIEGVISPSSRNPGARSSGRSSTT